MKIKRCSWQLCFSRYAIIAGLPKWISKCGAMEYRKVFIGGTMADLQEKIWILDKKALKKFKGRGPSDRPSSPLFPLPPILLALHCYVSYEISFCFKVIIFSGCIKSWSWNVLWSYEAMELPRKWIEFVNERIYIFKIVNYEYFALSYITKMFLWKINILCTLYIHLCTCVYICIDIHSWYIHIYIYIYI